MGRIPYYDVVLLAVGGTTMTIEYQGQDKELPCVDASELRRLAGLRGAVEVMEDSGPTVYRFHPYQDQSLQRLPELDAYSAHDAADWEAMRVGWRCATAPDGFDAPSSLIPGVNGAFVEDHSSSLSLTVPVEFEDLCAQLAMTPLQILRAFMANACALVSSPFNPRADGLVCISPEAVQAATNYLDEAHGKANTFGRIGQDRIGTIPVEQSAWSAGK